MFYRDPGAEDSGILAGIIDLSLAKSIEESEVARNYGFIVAVSWLTLSAYFALTHLTNSRSHGHTLFCTPIILSLLYAWLQQHVILPFYASHHTVLQ